MATSAESLWSEVPPTAPVATLGCVLEPGSLTERLMGACDLFAVELLHLGMGVAHPDEAAPIGVAPGDAISVRHVALTLDGNSVVMARSFCRKHCPTWFPILDRGGRSLGFTLFSGEVALTRGPLQFAQIMADHPLFELARIRAPGVARFPARRCRFEIDGAPLVVCEVFLPALETHLAAAAHRPAGAAARIAPPRSSRGG